MTRIGRPDKAAAAIRSTADKAVAATAGKILKYDGRPFSPEYIVQGFESEGGKR